MNDRAPEGMNDRDREGMAADTSARPPVKHRHSAVVASFRIPEYLDEALREESDRREETMAVTLRSILREWFEDHRDIRID